LFYTFIVSPVENVNFETAIGRVRPFVFMLTFKLLDLQSWFFRKCMDHDRSSSGTKCQGHRSKSMVMVEVRASIGNVVAV